MFIKSESLPSNSREKSTRGQYNLGKHVFTDKGHGELSMFIQAEGLPSNSTEKSAGVNMILVEMSFEIRAKHVLPSMSSETGVLRMSPVNSHVVRLASIPDVPSKTLTQNLLI